MTFLARVLILRQTVDVYADRVIETQRLLAELNAELERYRRELAQAEVDFTRFCRRRAETMPRRNGSFAKRECA